MPHVHIEIYYNMHIVLPSFSIKSTGTASAHYNLELHITEITLRFVYMSSILLSKYKFKESILFVTK